MLLNNLCVLTYKLLRGDGEVNGGCGSDRVHATHQAVSEVSEVRRAPRRVHDSGVATGAEVDARVEKEASREVIIAGRRANRSRNI